MHSKREEKFMKRKETQNVEFKQSWRDEFLKEICGFANAQGGMLLIGVDDSGKAVGVANGKRLMEDIPNKIVSLLGIVPDVNLVDKNGVEIIEIVVSPSSVPILYHGVCYYRSSTTKQELTGVALQQFILKKLGRSWDDVRNDYATLKDIDRNAIRYFIEKAKLANRIDVKTQGAKVEQVLESLGLIDGSGGIKNAAILLFAKKPLKFFPCVEFRIGRFGRRESDLIIQDSVDGNILQMTDRVMEILKAKYLTSPIHYEGLQRIEQLEIPELALREAIFNSIIHKDYTGAHIQLKVYDDRIVLWNEGNLPDGYTVKTLMGVHSSRPRNKNIASVFYRAGFIESWGRGIDKIRDALAEANLSGPKIEAFCGGVKLTIMRPKGETNPVLVVNKNLVTKKDDRVNDRVNFANEILVLVEKNPGLRSKDLAALAGKSIPTLSRFLKSLKDNGKIEFRGAPKNGGYFVK